MQTLPELAKEYTVKEWNELHGYDENDIPQVQYTWEGSGFNVAPSKVEVAKRGHLWICKRVPGSEESSSSLVAVLRYIEGHYCLTVLSGLQELKTIRIDTTGLSYEEMLRKVMIIYRLNGVNDD